jgi:hypothetical protein
MPEVEDGDEIVMMKITGVLVTMLGELNPELYGPYLVYEKNSKVQSTLRTSDESHLRNVRDCPIMGWSRGQLEQAGFKFNPYDPCVANQTDEGSQHTLLFHVDNLKSSHKDSKVNDKFDKWLQNKYGKHREVAIHQGKIHDYLGMGLDFCKKGKVKIRMTEYVESMMEDFP